MHKNKIFATKKGEFRSKNINPLVDNGLHVSLKQLCPSKVKTEARFEFQLPFQWL